MRVLPIDLGVTAGDQLLLDVGAVDGELCPRWWPPLRQVQIAVGDISPIPTRLRPALIIRTP